MIMLLKYVGFRRDVRSSKNKEIEENWDTKSDLNKFYFFIIDK